MCPAVQTASESAVSVNHITVSRTSADYHLMHSGLLPESRIPWLFLHGFTGSLKVWDHLRKQIGISSLALDLPGHGRSVIRRKATRFGFQQWAQDLKAVLNEMNLTKVRIYGYSMGGRLAMAFASHHPEMIKNLYLESCHPGLIHPAEKENRQKLEQNWQQRLKTDFRGFIDDWNEMPMFQKTLSRNPKECERLYKIRADQDGRQLALALRYLGTGRQPDYRMVFKQQDIPVKLITGCEDRKYVSLAHQTAVDHPHVQWENIPDAGHSVHLEQPARICSLIRNETA